MYNKLVCKTLYVAKGYSQKHIAQLYRPPTWWVEVSTHTKHNVMNNCNFNKG